MIPPTVVPVVPHVLPPGPAPDPALDPSPMLYTDDDDCSTYSNCSEYTNPDDLPLMTDFDLCLLYADNDSYPPCSEYTNHEEQPVPLDLELLLSPSDDDEDNHSFCSEYTYLEETLSPLALASGVYPASVTSLHLTTIISLIYPSILTWSNPQETEMPPSPSEDLPSSIAWLFSLTVTDATTPTRALSSSGSKPTGKPQRPPKPRKSQLEVPPIRPYPLSHLDQQLNPFDLDLSLYPAAPP